MLILKYKFVVCLFSDSSANLLDGGVFLLFLWDGSGHVALIWQAEWCKNSYIGIIGENISMISKISNKLQLNFAVSS